MGELSNQTLAKFATPADCQKPASRSERAAMDYRCPKHPDVRLQFVLKGGAGYCSRCVLYVQAAGVPEPARDVPRMTERPRRAAKTRVAKFATTADRRGKGRSNGE